MRVDTALALVNDGLALPPYWEVTAEDYTHRYEDTICLTVNITNARASERENQPDYATEVDGGARAKFMVPVGDCEGVEDLVYRVIVAFVEDFTHEVREFVRLKHTGWAPFHPHQTDGIKRWSQAHGTDVLRDYKFGLA